MTKKYAGDDYGDEMIATGSELEALDVEVATRRGEAHGRAVFLHDELLVALGAMEPAMAKGHAETCPLIARAISSFRLPRPARTCIGCGAPASMGASLGPSCPDCYDELSG
jgi:hypothetical protein